MPTGSTFRLARAAVFAAVCVVVTALGHALTSGGTLPLWAMGHAFAATAAAAWWLTGRERGALAVTGSTVVAQLGLHVLFMLSETLSAPSADAGMHHGMASGAAHGMAHDMAHMGGPAWHEWPGWPWQGGTAMALAHLLATLISAVWLWRGEAAAFRLGRALAAAVFVPLRIALRMLGAGTVPPPAWPSAPTAARRLRGVLLCHVIRRRGPPGRGPLPC
ncbi:hypothetical protein ABZU86_10965 [Streptomyces sp. NPDC005271]|uniref:hypothetical protein n=1 Tax=unclassified Streptomyces TaxID=2593676 RepID=UPI0033AC381B